MNILSDLRPDNHQQLMALQVIFSRQQSVLDFFLEGLIFRCRFSPLNLTLAKVSDQFLNVLRLPSRATRRQFYRLGVTPGFDARPPGRFAHRNDLQNLSQT